jgi:hypothetical protein
MTTRKPPIVNYERLIEMADELDRPVETLIALSPNNDPFYAGRGHRLRHAAWFAEVWRELGFGPGTHIRHVHYVLISQPEPIMGENGKPYQNTDECWKVMIRASRDARYLELVPIEDIIDRRNDEPIEYVVSSEEAATLAVEEPNVMPAKLAAYPVNCWTPNEPGFLFSKPTIDQQYQIELWCEKTTMNDILVDIARTYGLNVVTGSGEISLTACQRLVRRAECSGRKVRILYVTDFDPAGQSIPLACARKIEYVIRKGELDLDVQVRAVALTYEQCQHYRLPRTPMKETELRAAAFEGRYGEGATELDALEALHPGELRKILVKEVERYYDSDLDDLVEDVATEVRDELASIRAEIMTRHQKEVVAAKRELLRISKRCNAKIETAIKGSRTGYAKAATRFNRVQKKIADELQAAAPDLDLVEWPAPVEGDEDTDPLFDSSRNYIEQVDRYKVHQHKLTKRKKWERTP